MPGRCIVVIATTNPGKAREFATLLPKSVEVRNLSDLGLDAPEEIGATLAENALLKAIHASCRTDHIVLADDSGLEVDALRGEPGVRSARFAGEPADDCRNLQLLLARLRDFPLDRRGARFVCELVVAQAGQVLATSRGTCEGRIACEPRGALGFGYDPVFLLPTGRTMGEMAKEEKNRISHRADAFRKLPAELFGGHALDVERGT